jgi:putative flippase GtrA
MAQPVIKQFSQFAVVGGLGTLTNLVCFFLMVDVGGIAPLLGAVVAFCAAVTQNYLLNELWTFNPEGDNRVSRRRYAKFVGFSAVALCVNLAVLQLLLTTFDFPLKVIPQAVGIAAATGVNFVTSRLVTFR